MNFPDKSSNFIFFDLGFKLHHRVGSIHATEAPWQTMKLGREQFEFGRLIGPDHIDVIIAISGRLPDQEQAGMYFLQNPLLTLGAFNH